MSSPPAHGHRGPASSSRSTGENEAALPPREDVEQRGPAVIRGAGLGPLRVAVQPIFPFATFASFPFVNDLDRMDGIYSLDDPNFPSSTAEGPNRRPSRSGSDDSPASRGDWEIDVSDEHGGGGGGVGEDEDEDDDEDEAVYLPVAVPANFAARLGLHETDLTRALIAGDFALAERIICRETEDVDFLNDGVHSATPLNLALGGRASFGGNPRNLKIVKMLVDKGANVNLRIPHHDLENASESPLELLVALYLALLKMFASDPPPKCRSRQYIETNLLDVVGVNGEMGMSPQTVIVQTKDLLNFFLERGADVNLQTGDAGRTVFHMVLAADVTDGELIERMVHMGALVNLTDVHGTTPLMDVIRCKAYERGTDAYRALGKLDKRLLLDAQNCSGESALWRSMFYGKLSMCHLLLDEGAASFTMARVQENILRRQPQIMPYFGRWLRRPPCISNLPALLAPFLGNASCFTSAVASLGDQGSTVNRQAQHKRRFAVKTFNKIATEFISPLVDRGWFCTREVERTLHELLKVHTVFKHLTENKVFQEIAIISIMFGNHSGGLRQMCIREILVAALFSHDKDRTIKILKSLEPCSSPEVDHPRFIKRHQKCNADATRDSACVLPSGTSDSSAASVVAAAAADMSRLSLSEPELLSASASSSSPRLQRRDRTRHGSDRTGGGGGVVGASNPARRSIGENWLLQEDPSYAVHRVGGSLEEGLELEVSLRDESGSGEEEKEERGSEGGGACAVINDHAERRDSETLDVLHDAEWAMQEAAGVLKRADAVIAQKCEELLPHYGAINCREQCSNSSKEPEQDAEESVWSTTSPALSSSVSRLSREQDNVPPLSISSSSASSSSSTSASTSLSDPNGQEAFSLRHAVYADQFNSQSQSMPGASVVAAPSQESVIKSLNREKVAALADHLGLPPGLVPCLELEVARLQLGVAIFRHKSIRCDRGCEGDDDDESGTTTGGDEDDEDDPSWYDDDESLSAPSLTFSEDEDEDESDSGDTSDNEDGERDSVSPNLVSDENVRESTPSEDRVYRGAVRRSRSSEILGSESTTSDSESDIDGAVVGGGGGGRRRAFRAAHYRVRDGSGVDRPDEAQLRDLDPPVDDWFFFGGEEEHASTKRYVRENVVDEAKFENSTDSDTVTEDDGDEDQRSAEVAPNSASGGPKSAPPASGKDTSERSTR